MNELYMFLIVFFGVFLGMLLGEAVRFLVAKRSADKLFEELDALEKAHRKARNKDIELLNKTINFEKHDKKRRQRRNKNERPVETKFHGRIKTK